MILAGDVGGTNARLALVDIANNEPKIIEKKSYKCHDFQNVTDIILQFIKDTQYDLAKINSVCLALAGPIVGDKVKLTNLPWTVNLNELKHDLKQKKIILTNDFQAIGYGIDALNPQKDLYVLQKGKSEKNGIKAIMGAGTGLGISFMYWNDKEYIVSPSEAGQANFPPNDSLETEILLFLQKKYPRVPTELLLSGHGISNIYSYFLSLDAKKENPDLRSLMQKKDPAALITEYAIKYQDPLSLKTIDTFIKTYGSCAGNLAYAFLPKGGLFIAGGIAAKLIEQITDGRFMQAFHNKGKLSDILHGIPVSVILNPDVGLYGAALLAERKNALELNASTE